MNYVGRSHPDHTSPRRSKGATKYPPPPPPPVKATMPPTLTAARGYYILVDPAPQYGRLRPGT